MAELINTPTALGYLFAVRVCGKGSGAPTRTFPFSRRARASLYLHLFRLLCGAL